MAPEGLVGAVHDTVAVELIVVAVALLGAPTALAARADGVTVEEATWKDAQAGIAPTATIAASTKPTTMTL